LCAPARGPLLVFDRAGSQYLIPYALDGLNPVVLPTRFEEFYLTPRLILRLFANLRHIDEWKLRQFYKIYLLSCLQEIAPRVVITWVDNSQYFQVLSRLYPAAHFLAVQNGYRHGASLMKASEGGLLSDNPKWGSRLELPEFFILGPYTEELYSRHGHRIARARPVGSFLAGYYKTEIAPGAVPVEHDICLVSQWRAAIMDGDFLPNFRTGVTVMCERMARYAAERSLRVAVAAASADPREEAYFRKMFGAGVAVVRHDPAAFTTYRTMDRAEVSVAVLSTALFEAMGWGKKVLFCNFSGDAAYDCPLKGPWSVGGDEGYPEFARKLDALRSMSAQEYEAQAGPARRRLMSFDPARPAHRVIREAVAAALERKS
jgi:hypothetical protein